MQSSLLSQFHSELSAPERSAAALNCLLNWSSVSVKVKRQVHGLKDSVKWWTGIPGSDQHGTGVWVIAQNSGVCSTESDARRTCVFEMDQEL